MTRTMYATREEWLQALVAELRPVFGEPGVELPGELRVSCSWPVRGGLANRRRVLGECWVGTHTHDGIIQIKISPNLDDPLDVASTMVHELVHACRPTAGHGPDFRKAAMAVGLEGPMRGTVPGRALERKLVAITTDLGPYTHTRLGDPLRRDEPAEKPVLIPVDVPAKQRGSRMRKLACPSCGYLVRTTQKWIEVGYPTCPCGEEMRLAPANPRTGRGPRLI